MCFYNHQGSTMFLRGTHFAHFKFNAAPFTFFRVTVPFTMYHRMTCGSTKLAKFCCFAANFFRKFYSTGLINSMGNKFIGLNTAIFMFIQTFILSQIQSSSILYVIIENICESWIIIVQLTDQFLLERFR